jgi:hypothetical protein
MVPYTSKKDSTATAYSFGNDDTATCPDSGSSVTITFTCPPLPPKDEKEEPGKARKEEELKKKERELWKLDRKNFQSRKR